MPVRIYDIAKKLGIESKDVLAKAKELGINEARVASSSLDKITAEYLESQFSGATAPDSAPAPAAEAAPIKIISAPPPEPEPEPSAPEPVAEEQAPAEEVYEAPAAEPADAPVEARADAEPTAEVDDAPAAQAPVAEAASAPATQPETAKAPEAPKPEAAKPADAAPKLGEKIGFIQLPKKPMPPGAPKVGDKVGSVQLPPRPSSNQPQRPGGPQQNRPGQQQPQQRPGGPQQFQQRPGGPQQNRPGQGQGPGQGRPDSRFGNRPGGGGYQQQPFGRGPAGQGGPQQQRPGQPQAGNRPGANKSDLPSDAPVITMKPPIVVRDLAEQLKRKPFQLIADLMELGVFANVNQAVEEDIAKRLCAKHGVKFELEKRERGGGVVHAPVKKIEIDADDKPEQLKPRPPVVTIMGHVDHGKTTLLDSIRKANVVSGEAGGITQHIGAYTIAFPHPERKGEIQQITFLDTPGHAAFSAMRARGANVTDIVVLVVAANDGVMPQTLEALSHAQAANVKIIVAVNKCDHPNANPMKVRQQLQEKGLVPDDWGGETIYVDCSGLTKIGVDKLLEMILLQADLLELKANPDRKAKGNVIESGLQPGGPTATVLVRKGTLKVGDVILCGEHYGKVRALINEEDKRMKEAGPSHAVKVLGLNGVPEAGAEFIVVDNEKAAREEAEKRELEARAEASQESRAKVTLETLFSTLAESSAKVLKIVVKADTQGSIEAIVDALNKIESDKVSLEVIHYAVGTITESDVLLASASKAIVLGFHTRIDNGVSDVAKREGVQIKLYSIIYELIDQVKDAMSGLLDPLIKDVVVGSAEVRQLFELSKGGCVAGCAVTSGRIVKGKVRVMRRKSLVFEGGTTSLRRFQDEVNEVRSGMECGIRLDGFNEFQIGDVIECFSQEKVAQKL
jgi:translation initiation factor IF-2